MDELFLQFLHVAIATLIASFAIISFFKLFRNQTRKHLVPESGGAWPIIGHLPLFWGSKLPHKVLAAMADTYGPMFMIRIGVHKALVISSTELAQVCLQDNDKAVSGRPKSVAGDLLTYNYALFGLGPYGSYWRHMRKTLMLELLSNHRLNSISHVWNSEVNEFIRELHTFWHANQNSENKVLVDLKKKFGGLSTKIIVRITTGKKLVDGQQISRNGGCTEEGLEIQEGIREFMEGLGSFCMGDAVPFLRWMDNFGGQKKAIKRTFKKIDGILQRWLDEHKEKKNSSKDKDEHEYEYEGQDLMSALLSTDLEVVKDYCNYDADTINKATCLSAILGGGDSSGVALTWAVSLLLNNPHVLKRAQVELAAQIGKGTQVEETDVSRLVYLQAIVKETLRLYPPSQILAPREFIEDCMINGYHVKSGTRLMVNLYKISRDPKIWEDPLEFRPERFLSVSKDVDFRGKHFGFIPFGAGRRVCPGISLSLQVMHLALARFLHAFELSTPFEEPVDMSERIGLSNSKAKPLEVLIAPSLSCKAYL